MRLLKTLVPIISLSLVLTFSNAQAGHETDRRDVRQTDSTSVQFVDLLWLKPGVKPESAAHYFKVALRPILQKHGGRLLYVYKIDAAIKGELKPAITAGLVFPSMQALQAIFTDPDYQKIIPLRDATFDFTQQSLLKVSPL